METHENEDTLRPASSGTRVLALGILMTAMAGCNHSTPSTRVEPDGKVVILNDDGSINEEASAILEGFRAEAKRTIDRHRCIVPNSALEPTVKRRDLFYLQNGERQGPERWTVIDTKCDNRRFVIRAEVENCTKCRVLKDGKLLRPTHQRKGSR